MKRCITAVIVLYKLRPEESVSYRSLLHAAAHIPTSVLDLHIVLYDNTPVMATVGIHGLAPNVHYIADANNSGLASAYNAALTMAVSRGDSWLLTLDQDTNLPEHTFDVLLSALNAVEERPDVAAIVAHIVAQGRVVSPNTFVMGAWPRAVPLAFTGIPKETVYAFNSGSLLRTAALQQIGGYSNWFWLDNSDAFLYRQLQRFGKAVYVAGELVLDHDFSMLNMQDRISPERYESILLFESAFWDMEMNGGAGLERTLRLAGRLWKHARRGDGPQLRHLTRQALWRRLFHTRRRRLDSWQSMVERQLGKMPAQWHRNGDVRVSVCLAAYQGEPYIEAQLRSIWPQLRTGDEIVVVDDASQDGTATTIERVRLELRAQPHAPNLILVHHTSNQGVVRTFEEAVRSASGDILFLCDGDDLWAPNKVAKVLEAFAANPRARVVCTELSLIDRDGHYMPDDGVMQYRRFTSSPFANLVHNQYQGSTMAFRSSLLADILPFPKDRLFLHDAWIGMRNTLSGGETVFLDEPLLLYRRHAGNYSRQYSRGKQVLLRLQMVWAQVQRMLLTRKRVSTAELRERVNSHR